MTPIFLEKNRAFPLRVVDFSSLLCGAPARKSTLHVYNRFENLLGRREKKKRKEHKFRAS